MKDTELERNLASGLEKMLGLNDAANADWRPADLAESLRHQLARSLQEDLRAVAANGGAPVDETIARLAATDDPAPLRSFADLFRHPRPPVELLLLVKEFARLGRESGTIPADVAAMLYYTSVAAALLRCGVRITELDDRTLGQGLQWAHSRQWADESICALTEECLNVLRAASMLAGIANSTGAGTNGEGADATGTVVPGAMTVKGVHQGASERTEPEGPAPAREPRAPREDETLSAADLRDTTPTMSVPGAAARVVSHLPGYRFVRLLGRGAMGEVWQAVQLSTHRDVAVKLMGAQFDSDKARLLFDREVELTANLEHPHIARVYDSGHHEGIYYYVMELIRGLPLDRYVTKASLDRPAVLRLFATVCLAVDFAHLRGVIHRDLKPSNIMVDEQGRPRVGDFGLAKLAARTGATPAELGEVPGDGNVDAEGDIIGTPAYMSPEQAAGRSLTLDTRTDVYSLGVILYRLLSGRYPRDVSGSLRDVLRRVIELEPAPPRSVANIDGELEALLLKALAREPEQRYHTAGALARDIENYLNGMPLIAGPTSTWYILRKWSWRHRFEASVAAAVAASLLFMGVYSYVRVANERNMAVEAKNDAISARLKENIARVAAEDAGKIAHLRLADSEVSEGDSKASQGSWEQAARFYARAHDDYVNAGASPLSSDLGLWAADRACPPPLCRVSGIAGPIMDTAFIPGGPRIVTAGADGQLRTWDLVTGRQMSVFRDPKVPAPSTGSPSSPQAGSTQAPAADDENAEAFTCVQVCSDGSTAVSGSRDGVMRVWDLGTGGIRRRLSPPGPSGRWVRRIATGGHNGLLALCVTCDPPFAGNSPDGLTLWELDQGRLLRELPEAGQVVAAAFSRDGTRLLTAGSNLCLWDVASGNRLCSLDCGNAKASAIAFSPGGRAAVVGFESAGAGGGIRVWDLTEPSDPKSLRPLASSKSRVSGVGFAADNGPVLAADAEGTIRVLDLATGVELSRCMPAATVPRSSGPNAPGADTVASSEPAAALSPDGQLGLLFWDADVAVWDLRPGPEMRSLETPHRPDISVADVSFVGEGRMLLARTAGVPALWDVPTGKRLVSPRFDSPAAAADGRGPDAARSQLHSALAVDGSGKLMALLQEDRVSVWRLDDVRQASLLGSFKVAIGNTESRALAISGSGRVVTAGADNDLVLWDARSGKPLATLTGNTDKVTSVAFSPDGRWLLSGCLDRSALLWDVSSIAPGPATASTTAPAPAASPPIRLAGHDDGVNAVCFSRDGRWAATGSGNSLVDVRGDNTVRLWDPNNGRLVRVMRGHAAPVRSIAFSPNGQMIVSGDESGMIKLWDAASGRELRSIEGHAGAVISTAFSNDGTLIASADSAGALRLWDIATPALRRKLEPEFARARQALGQNPGDGNALLACAQWYAFRRASAWAADARRRALACSVAIDSLDLARSDWEAGDPRAAAQEFQQAIDSGTADLSGNLRLCRDTAAEEAGRPSGPPTASGTR